MQILVGFYMEIIRTKDSFSLGNVELYWARRRDIVISVFPTLMWTVNLTVNMQRGWQTPQQRFYRIWLAGQAIVDAAVALTSYAP